MKIRMTGIDYKKADIELREQFSFTKNELGRISGKLKRYYPGIGFAFIITCNRTELWMNGETMNESSPYSILCELKGIERERYKSYAVNREGLDAVSHLFYLTCGMESQIFGEDQILSQVKEGIRIAREQDLCDSVLEKLFQYAISAAKKVKTNIHLTIFHNSIIHRTMEVLKGHVNSFCGINCLVIGNGEMGRAMVKSLVNEGANVTMTLRSYKHGDTIVPFGCQVAPYEKRLLMVKDAAIIISATSSPHHTLHVQETMEILRDGKMRILIDLAVPRDIPRCFGQMDQVTLYDIDSLGTIAAREDMDEQIKKVKEILKEFEEEFITWYHFREWIPVIDEIGRTIASDTVGKLTQPLKQLDLSTEQRENLKEQINISSFKSVTKVMYGLKNQLSKDEWGVFLSALLETAKDS